MKAFNILIFTLALVLTGCYGGNVSKNVEESSGGANSSSSGASSGGSSSSGSTANTVIVDESNGISNKPAWNGKMLAIEESSTDYKRKVVSESTGAALTFRGSDAPANIINNSVSITSGGNDFVLYAKQNGSNYNLMAAKLTGNTLAYAASGNSIGLLASSANLYVTPGALLKKAEALVSMGSCAVAGFINGNGYSLYSFTESGGEIVSNDLSATDTSVTINQMKVFDGNLYVSDLDGTLYKIDNTCALTTLRTSNASPVFIANNTPYYLYFDGANINLYNATTNLTSQSFTYGSALVLTDNGATFAASSGDTVYLKLRDATFGALSQVTINVSTFSTFGAFGGQFDLLFSTNSGAFGFVRNTGEIINLSNLATVATVSEHVNYANYGGANSPDAYLIQDGYLPVEFNDSLYFPMDSGNESKLYRLAGNTPTVVGSLGSIRPRMLKVFGNSLYFVGDDTSDTDGSEYKLFKVDTNNTISEVSTINGSNYLLHNIEVINQLGSSYFTSSSDPSLGHFSFDIFSINGSTRFSIHGNNKTNIGLSEAPEASTQSISSFSSKPIRSMTTPSFTLSYAIGKIAGASSNAVEYLQTNDDGTYLFKVFASKGMQIYKSDGAATLERKTNVAEGVGLGLERSQNSLVKGNFMYFSNIRNDNVSASSIGTIGDSGQLFKLNLTTNETTEVLDESGNNLYGVKKLIKGNSETAYTYFWARNPNYASGDNTTHYNSLFYIDDSGIAKVVQGSYKVGFGTITFFAHDYIIFFTKDSSTGALSLWSVNTSTNQTIATEQLQNLEQAPSPVPDLASTPNYATINMVQGNYQILEFSTTSNKYFTINIFSENSEETDALLYAFFKINSNGTFSKISGNEVLGITKIQNSLYVNMNGQLKKYDEDSNTFSSSLLNPNIGYIMGRIFGVDNKIFFYSMSTESMNLIQGGSSSSSSSSGGSGFTTLFQYPPKLRSASISNNSISVDEIESLMNINTLDGLDDTRLQYSIAFSMMFNATNIFGLSKSGNYIYATQFDVDTTQNGINIGGQNFAYKMTPKIVIYNTSTSTKTLLPMSSSSSSTLTLSINSLDFQTLQKIRNKGAFINGLPTDGAFFYTLDMTSTSNSISMEPIVYYIKGTSIHWSYSWEITGSDFSALLQKLASDVTNPSCFIATAAWGSQMDEHVDMIRAFRNKFLLTNEAGKWFVKNYYKYSPPIAEYIAKHDTLRAFVRGALWPLVAYSYLSVNYGAFTALLIMLSLAVLALKVTQLSYRRYKHTKIK